MKKKDLNHIAKIEKAIKDKYGEEAIQNPRGSWNQEKEEKYLNDLKDFYEKNSRNETKGTLRYFPFRNGKLIINRVYTFSFIFNASSLCSINELQYF